ncbi:hypothetical protein CLOSTMETH_03757 [[Clostridium] methylpentosum DSM 5476]|uniref:Uncharacterized protein n=1 Tax=[Clostridium] methylpentosum DSM 5476 TaxID=537013 RepID=C0EIR2_9FIRM|nr:hypothetical protein CLOSTMETH_03757 [[Clostridium] methylpentosum DSM 5476]
MSIIAAGQRDSDRTDCTKQGFVKSAFLPDNFLHAVIEKSQGRTAVLRVRSSD